MYVYGDDIIIPIDAVEIVSETLTRFYCKVNSSKSFWNGKFRESCGMDAYDGNCVTPTYLRRIRPRNMRMVKEIISWIATSNLFYKRGYWLTAALLKNKVESVTGKLPVIREDSPGLGWFSFMGTFAKGKWSKTLHCMLYSTFVESPIYKQDPLDDWPALLKCLINLEYRQSDDIEVDSKHLERSSRSGTSALKRRWLPLS